MGGTSRSLLLHFVQPYELPQMGPHCLNQYSEQKETNSEPGEGGCRWAGVRGCDGVGERAFWGGDCVAGMAETGELSALL